MNYWTREILGEVHLHLQQQNVAEVAAHLQIKVILRNPDVVTHLHRADDLQIEIAHHLVHNVVLQTTILLNEDILLHPGATDVDELHPDTVQTHLSVDVHLTEALTGILLPDVYLLAGI